MADDGYLSTALKMLSTAAVVASNVNPYLKVGYMAYTITVDFVQGWNASKKNLQNANEETRENVNEETRQNAKKEIPQLRLIEGVAEEGGILYKQEVVRYSQEPYTVRYSHPTDTITGIACVPVSAEIQSPEAEIIEGGINYKSVTIELTPVEKGKWACDIVICGKSSAAKPSAAIQSAAKPAIETGPADASASERSSRTIPQCRRLVEGTPEEGDALQDMTFARRSREPYDYEYSKAGYTFTGISCLPVSAEIPSLEAEVIKGGVNCSSVTIRLTPVEEGEWACRVVVYGRLDTTGPAAETGSGDASETSHRTIHQCGLIEGRPEECDVLHEKKMVLQSGEPYEFKYSKPGYTFTGISCLPVSAEIQSPEAEVIKGGVNKSLVTIRLKPVVDGEWACRVVVYGKLCTTVPSAEIPKQQTGRTDASAYAAFAAVSASAAPGAAISDSAAPGAAVCPSPPAAAV